MTWLEGLYPIFLTAALAANVYGATAPSHLRVQILQSGADQRAVTAPGAVSTIAIGVSNARNTSDANDVVLSIVLPAGLGFENSGRRPDSVEDRKVRWNLGTLKAGEAVHVIEMDVKAATDIPTAADVAIEAQIAGRGNAGVAVTDTASLVLSVRPAGANLAVTSNLRAITLLAGQSASFEATVANLGTASAAATTLAVTLPPGVRFNSADAKLEPSNDAKTLNWALGDLQRGEARTVTMTVDLDPRLEMKRHSGVNALSFSFDASSSSPDVDPADNHLKIVRGVDAEGHDVAIWLNVEGGPGGEIKAGKEATVVLVYANLGRQEAHDTVATLRAAPAANENADRPLGTWQLGNLPAGAQGMIRVAFPIVAGSQTRLTALILAGGQDANLDNNTARAFLRETRASLKTVALKSAPTDAPSKQVGWLLPAVSIAVLLLLAGVVTWWLRRRKP